MNCLNYAHAIAPYDLLLGALNNKLFMKNYEGTHIKKSQLALKNVESQQQKQFVPLFKASEGEKKKLKSL
ncbi:hypothetical protein EPI10_032194 [Gossypium australe]|uniref:Uncharacterized protein n=1 Tax=Gossypium australe TaxID=47621 RepID=A0A5B6X2Q4_9ROSI|nr:hypothetical protein EPI10_032194 [Gossypium australe]